jgi:preprotein translocase subunit YajC
MTPATHTLFAEGEGQGQPQQPPGGGMGGPLGPMFMIVMVMMFVFIVVMPAMNRRQRREQEAMLAGIKRGSKILTNAGIVGVVVTAKEGEDEIVIKSEDARLRIKRSVVVQVLGSDEAEAAKTA